MPFSKQTLLAPLCNYTKCNERATHTVVDGNHYRIGDYCEKHADKKVEARNEYDDAVNRACRR